MTRKTTSCLHRKPPVFSITHSITTLYRGQTLRSNYQDDEGSVRSQKVQRSLRNVQVRVESWHSNDSIVTDLVGVDVEKSSATKPNLRASGARHLASSAKAIDLSRPGCSNPTPNPNPNPRPRPSSLCFGLQAGLLHYSPNSKMVESCGLCSSSTRRRLLTSPATLVP